MKLTAKTVVGLTLPAGKTDAIFFDDELTGFGIRLRANGDRIKRGFVAQYRHAGRTRRMLVGSAEKLSVEQAKTAARKILAKVELDQDPQAEREKARQQAGGTLRAAIADYLEMKKPAELVDAKRRKDDGRVRMRTYGELVRYLLTSPHFRPLHTLQIGRVTRQEVAARLRRITVENGSITASRARSALSAFFVWASQEGLCEINPVIGTRKPANARARERVLGDLELVAVWRAATAQGYGYGRIVRLLILTGCRREEIGGLRWSEIDLDSHAIRIPGERSKNHRAHEVPLSDFGWAILSQQPRPLDNSEFVFGNARGRAGFNGWTHGKIDLDKRLAAASEEIGAWVIHDLRRSVATGMADLGIEPHHIEAVLNHHGGHRAGVAGVYNRSSYQRAVTAALARWSEHVEQLVSGKPAGKVVQLRG